MNQAETIISTNTGHTDYELFRMVPKQIRELDVACGYKLDQSADEESRIWNPNKIKGIYASTRSIYLYQQQKHQIRLVCDGALHI